MKITQKIITSVLTDGLLAYATNIGGRAGFPNPTTDERSA